MKQYVQHKSGQGEKWEVDEVRTLSGCSVVCVKPKVHSNAPPLLPWSEYIPCDPPEEWEDVTMIHRHRNGHKGLILNVLIGENERIRFIDGPHNGPCFIVERKKA